MAYMQMQEQATRGRHLFACPACTGSDALHAWWHVAFTRPSQSTHRDVVYQSPCIPSSTHSIDLINYPSQVLRQVMIDGDRPLTTRIVLRLVVLEYKFWAGI